MARVDDGNENEHGVDVAGMFGRTALVPGFELADDDVGGLK